MTPMTASEEGFFLAIRGDTVEIRSSGSFDRERAEQVVAAIAAVRAVHPRTFILAASGGSISPDSRKFITEWLRTSPLPLETAVWGAGVLHRAIAEMLFRGARLFRPGRFLVTFHRTRDDALAWIEARRGVAAPS
jgi:hypothetical protein